MHRTLRILERAGILAAHAAAELNQRSRASRHIVTDIVESGIPEIVVADALAAATRTPLLDVAKVSEGLAEWVSAQVVSEHLCVPIRVTEDNEIVLGMVDPSDLDAIDKVRFATGRSVQPRTMQLSTFWEVAPRHWYLGYDLAMLLDHMLETGETPLSQSVDDGIADMVLMSACKARRPIEISLSESRAAISDGWDVPASDPKFLATRRLIETLRDRSQAVDEPLGGFVLYMGVTPTYWVGEFSDDDQQTRITQRSRAQIEELFGPLDP